MPDGLVPADFLPRIIDGMADHGSGDAVLVGGITPGEPAFHASMALVGLAVLPGHHAHDLVALELGAEPTTHPTVCAGGDDRMLGLAPFDDGFFLQRGSGTGLDAGSAGDAVAFQEGLRLPCNNAGLEPPARRRERKGALHFFAGAHAATAHGALGRVGAEVRVGVILFAAEVIGSVIAGAYRPRPHRTGDVLQWGVAVGR